VVAIRVFSVNEIFPCSVYIYNEFLVSLVEFIVACTTCGIGVVVGLEMRLADGFDVLKICQ
jgi:hypothetical protein